ncbi:MAG: hypothetical protein ACREBE_17580, partial [bacterium]
YVPRSSKGNAALRAPLLVKLLGANLLVVATLLLGSAVGGGLVGLMVLGAMAFGANALLVVLALRPIRDLEATAWRVWRGDLGARVTQSAVADNEVMRVGATFNVLLNCLADDRARMTAMRAKVNDA